MAKKKVVTKAAKKSIKKSATRKPVKKKATKKTAKKSAPKKVSKHTLINPYLTFAGNCEEAFNFYKNVFGGKFQYIGRFNEMPPMDGKPMPPEEGQKIMHVSLPIGGESILMGSDSSEAFGHATVIGNNFSISVNAPDNAKADYLFNGLAAGGQATMPMSMTFWGSYFGMLTDKFGIQWMVSVEEKK